VIINGGKRKKKRRKEEKKKRAVLKGTLGKTSLTREMEARCKLLAAP